MHYFLRRTVPFIGHVNFTERMLAKLNQNKIYGIIKVRVQQQLNFGKGERKIRYDAYN